MRNLWKSLVKANFQWYIFAMSEDYTEEDSVVSFMEFGAIDTKNSKRDIWGFKTHQKAYDWFMLSRYANDMVAYRKMIRFIEKGDTESALKLYGEEIHHPDDASLNISKLLALEVVGRRTSAEPSFIELGSTIFGHIEGMELVQSVLRSKNIGDIGTDLAAVEWHGIDISDFLNEIAVQLHEQKYKVHVYLERKDAPSGTSLFFAKGVTLLYAFNTVSDFIELINKSDIALFDYSFSMSDIQKTTIGTGKSVTYLNYEEFMKALEGTGKKLTVRKGKTKYNPENKRLWVECIVANEADTAAFIDLDTKVRIGLKEALPTSEAADYFTQQATEGMFEWMPVEDFVKQAI